MTCSDVERILPEVLDGAPDGPFPDDFETHVKSCPACSDLVSDLKLIQSGARQLAATEEPAPRLWIRIAAELRAEAVIREPETAPARPVLVPSYNRRRWNAWWMAPVAAAILAAGSYVVSHKPAPSVAKQQVPVPQAISPAPVLASTPVKPAVTPVPTPVPAPQQMAQNTATQKPAARHDVEAASDPEDQQFLSVVSTLSPSMRTTYENQLQAVNADIRETQAYVNRNPGDTDARQHLMDAYQQKALLYQIALDRIQ
jgi:Putative zinc-finger